MESGKLKVESWEFRVDSDSPVGFCKPDTFCRCSAGTAFFPRRKKAVGKNAGRETVFPDTLPYPLRRQDGLSARLDSSATRLYPPPITSATHASFPRFGLGQSLRVGQKRKANALRLGSHGAFALKVLPHLISYRFQTVPFSFAESSQ